MSRNVLKSVVAGCLLTFSCIQYTIGQSRTPLADRQGRPVNHFYRDTLIAAKRLWVEVNFMLNPIYSVQFSTKYILNGAHKNFSPLPRFYVVQPGTNPLSSVTEILDQSNAIYVNVRPKFFDSLKSKFFRDMRLIFGITHDKLETSSPDVFYKFPSGGTQLTFLLDKNLNTLIKGVFKELDFETVNLIFNFDVSAGFFMGLANVYADIRTPDSTIKSEKAADYIWQDDKPGINVWGWQVATSFEVGGVLGRKHIWKHLGITVGAKTMFEGLYTGTDVLVNNVPGYRLRMCNYGLFFVGPVLNIKILNF